MGRGGVAARTTPPAQALTAQGAAGVGPTYLVTEAPADHIVATLDGEPAVNRLREALSDVVKSDPRVAELLKNALLVGLRKKGSADDNFLVRQVRGATSDGMLLVGDPSIVAGAHPRGTSPMPVAALRSRFGRRPRRRRGIAAISLGIRGVAAISFRTAAPRSRFGRCPRRR